MGATFSEGGRPGQYMEYMEMVRCSTKKRASIMATQDEIEIEARSLKKGVAKLMALDPAQQWMDSH